MNLHEYQGREILEFFGVNTPRVTVIFNASEAKEAALKLIKLTGTKSLVIKAQIHAGGRGKGGGVKIAKSIHDVEKICSEMIGMQLFTAQTPKEGKKVERVMLAENVYQDANTNLKEYYISILLDRALAKNTIVYSTEGGMDIEEVAQKHPNKIFKEAIDPTKGISEAQIKKITSDLGIDQQRDSFRKFLKSLYEAYLGCDATLMEINPMLRNANGEILAVDAKVVLDDNALFRHPKYKEMRDKSQEDPMEVEAAESGLNFVRLNGNVACMVNGAGLAMATMDMIKISGAEPANFLDVGGTADAKRVEKAFEIILKEKKVEVILVNIFGGIVRCDRVAQGIIEAYRNLGEKIQIPLVVRLEGTNSEIAKSMIEDSNLKIHPVETLKEAAESIRKFVSCL